MIQEFCSSLFQMRKTYKNGGYPPFVYPGKDTSAYLPVFFFHDIGKDEFTSQLTYLGENGYSTIDCEEATIQLDRGMVDGRSVMLTVDDGLVSLYQTIYPLAKKFKVKIVAYVVPDWIGQEGYVTWQQCREMHDSGVVDLQSHSCAHARRITMLKVQDIWQRDRTPGKRWDVPELRPEFLQKGVRSFPIFPGESLFDVDSLVTLPAAFWQECLERGSGESGEISLRMFQELADRYQGEAMRVTGEALTAEMATELAASKAAIESELPGHSVWHFAFPWHLNSATSWQALEEAGFRSAAVGLELPGEGHVPGGVRKLLRVNGDYLFCLPGNNRRGFGNILARKIQKRLGLRIQGTY